MCRGLSAVKNGSPNLTLGQKMEEKASSSVIVIRGKILLSLICLAANRLWMNILPRANQAMQCR